MGDDLNQLIKQQYAKVEQLRENGINPYPAAKGISYDEIWQLREQDDKSGEELEQLHLECSIAGRLKGGIRNFGSIIFFDVWDRSGRIQIAISKKEIGKDTFKFIEKFIDVGDIVSAHGTLFKTQKGELSIHATTVELLTKSVRPLPEKWHGFTDVEARYRQRYLDMIMNPEVANTFRVRSEIIRLFRSFFDERDFIEVETPMMQPIAGGATARPSRPSTTPWTWTCFYAWRPSCI